MISLKTNEGEWVKGDRLDDHVVSYFSNLFSSNLEYKSIEFLSTLDRKVPKSMGLELDCDFSASEITLALKHMHPTKVLGLNGMPPLFYQKFWHIVGPLLLH